MKFDLDDAIEILERTPVVVANLLSGLSDSWIAGNEGGESWSPFDIAGHFVVGEKTDWLGRTKIILEHGTSRPFEPFDRFAQFHESKGKTVEDLLDEFARLRAENLQELSGLVSKNDLDKKGVHPEFGEVTLRQLLAAWVVHDLGHIAQISRVMSKQYRNEAGPWVPVFGSSVRAAVNGTPEKWVPVFGQEYAQARARTLNQRT